MIADLLNALWRWLTGQAKKPVRFLPPADPHVTTKPVQPAPAVPDTFCPLCGSRPPAAAGADINDVRYCTGTPEKPHRWRRRIVAGGDNAKP